MASSRNSVRMGPISLFALVIAICLAVLSVLAATTSQATFASAERQAAFTQDTYQNEAQAQAFVADIDKTLSALRAEGSTTDATLEELARTLPDNAWIEERTVFARFEAASGRTLTIGLAIEQGAHYRIIQWKATTQWVEPDNETLWTGTAD